MVGVGLGRRYSDLIVIVKQNRDSSVVSIMDNLGGGGGGHFLYK